MPDQAQAPFPPIQLDWEQIQEAIPDDVRDAYKDALTSYRLTRIDLETALKTLRNNIPHEHECKYDAYDQSVMDVFRQTTQELPGLFTKIEKARERITETQKVFRQTEHDVRNALTAESESE